MNKIKKYLPKGISNSAILWNSILIVSLVILFLINIEWAGWLYFIMSVLAIGFVLDADMISDEKWNRNIWLFITAPFLFVLALACVIFPLVFIFDHTIIRFNCYLDKKEFKSFFSAD